MQLMEMKLLHQFIIIQDGKNANSVPCSYEASFITSCDYPIDGRLIKFNAPTPEGGVKR